MTVLDLVNQARTLRPASVQNASAGRVAAAGERSRRLAAAIMNKHLDQPVGVKSIADFCSEQGRTARRFTVRRRPMMKTDAPLIRTEAVPERMPSYRPDTPAHQSSLSTYRHVQRSEDTRSKAKSALSSREQVRADKSSSGRDAESPVNEQLAQSLLEAAIHSSSFRFLDGHIQRILGKLLRVGAPSLRVYTGAQADAAAKAVHADAIAYRSHLFFRSGMFDPKTPAGIGLIAHEMMHVDRRPFATPPLGSSNLESAEEERALGTETFVRSVMVGQSPTSIFEASATAPATNHAFSTATPASHAARPTVDATPAIRTASRSRDVSGVGSQAEQPNVVTTVSAAQIRAIKDELYVEILDRIRTDFERGA